MRFLRERMTVSPETGLPDPDLDVADVSGEATALRRAVKQVRDAKWNLEKARDEAPDEGRKDAYKSAADDLDKMHGVLSPIYDELRSAGAQPRIRGRDVAEARTEMDAVRTVVRTAEHLVRQLRAVRDASPDSWRKDKFHDMAVDAERIAARIQDVGRGAVTRREQSHAGQYRVAAGIRPFLDPKPDKEGDDFGAQPRGRTVVGTDKQAGIPYGEARERGRDLLRESHITLSAVEQEPWYPGLTTWTPPVEHAAQGDYGFGDPSRGAVRAVAGDARGPVHPNEVAEAVAEAVAALYAEGRATDYRWHGHTTGMPDELGEGMIVTQEEVYWAVRRLSGDNAATPEYLDGVYKELNRLGLRVATRRPNTLERRRHTP